MAKDNDQGKPDQAKRLATRPEDQQSTLPSTNLIEQALTDLSEEKLQQLKEQAADEALQLQKRRAELQDERLHADEMTRSHIDAAHTLAESDRLTKGSFPKSHKVETHVSTGTGHRRIESKSGPTCFVATVCFGPESAEVEYLRDYRDDVLRQSPKGRAFIKWYYRYGPGLANLARKFRVLRVASTHAVRLIIWHLKRRS